MQLLSSILACSLAALPLSQAAALSLPSTSLNTRAAALEGKMAAHKLASIDITNGIPTGPIDWFNDTTMAMEPADLERRRSIDYCIANTAQAGVCIAVGGVLAQIGTGVASVVKSKSNKHDCSAATKQLDGVTWRVHATGRNCDTTAQLGTIAGAIDNYLRDQDKDVCGTHCIRLTHGGTWAGYVAIAPSGTDLNSFYCGANYRFGNCGSGGVNDDHN